MVMNKEEQFETKSKEILDDISESKKQTILLESIEEQLIQLNGKKKTQIKNQVNFETNWAKSKRRGNYFTGFTIMLMAGAIALDIVQIKDLDVIIERVKFVISAWGLM